MTYSLDIRQKVIDYIESKRLIDFSPVLKLAIFA
ncbi:MAG: hypothetical protein F6K18_13025 [Okeania sp. SIO2C2]|nr:hypothetical protein [Okeania sp. SIO2C2]